MYWNKGRLVWKIAKFFYFCHLKKLVSPETFWTLLRMVPMSLTPSHHHHYPFYSIPLSFFGILMFWEALKYLTLSINVYIPVCAAEHLRCKASRWQLLIVSPVVLCDLHAKCWRLVQTQVCRSHNISYTNRLHPASRKIDVWSGISSRTRRDCCCWTDRTTGRANSNGVTSQHLPVCVTFRLSRHCKMRYVLFLDLMQCRLVIPYALFGTTYRFHLQRSSSSSCSWISVACLPVNAVLQFPAGCDHSCTATPSQYCTRHFVSILKCTLTFKNLASYI